MLKIKDIREAKKYTQDQIIKITGIPKRTYSNYEAGKTDPKLSTLQLIASALNVSVSTLIDEVESSLHPVMIEEKVGVPLIPTEAFAGMGGDNPPIAEGDIIERYLIPDFVNIDFMIRVKGDSMIPQYNSGDIVACRMTTESNFMQWNRVHVISTRDQGVMIKRVKSCKEDPESLLVISDNREYDPFKLPKEQILNIALVVGSIRLE